MDKELNIILIEDDPGDRKLEQMIINQNYSHYHINMNIFNNGKEAAGFIENLKTPLNNTLVLIDVNLPLVNGHELLKLLKNNNLSKYCYTVMLTTSSSQNDIDMAFENRAFGYFRKPSTIDELESTITTIIDYWLLTYKHS